MRSGALLRRHSEGTPGSNDRRPGHCLVGVLTAYTGVPTGYMGIVRRGRPIVNRSVVVLFFWLPRSRRLPVRSFAMVGVTGLTILVIFDSCWRVRGKCIPEHHYGLQLVSGAQRAAGCRLDVGASWAGCTAVWLCLVIRKHGTALEDGFWIRRGRLDLVPRAASGSATSRKSIPSTNCAEREMIAGDAGRVGSRRRALGQIFSRNLWYVAHVRLHQLWLVLLLHVFLPTS